MGCWLYFGQFRDFGNKICKILDKFSFCHLLMFWFFYLVFFCYFQKKRFLALQSSFLGFQENKKKISPNFQNFRQLSLLSFFDIMTLFTSFWSLQKKLFSISSKILIFEILLKWKICHIIFKILDNFYYCHFLI